MFLVQIQDYLELIKEQILIQIKLLVKKPTRSLSAGASKDRRDLIPFKSNQNAFITVYNLILDNYIRIRFAFQSMDEVWLYLIESCYPTYEPIQASQTSFCLFEQAHKRLFNDIMNEYYISTFKTLCCLNHTEMHQQFSTLDSELVTFTRNSEARNRIKERYGGYTLASLVK